MESAISLANTKTSIAFNYLPRGWMRCPALELEHFVAIMDSGCDEVNDLDDLINLTYNLDNYDFIPDIKDYDDLGRVFTLRVATTLTTSSRFCGLH